MLQRVWPTLGQRGHYLAKDKKRRLAQLLAIGGTIMTCGWMAPAAAETPLCPGGLATLGNERVCVNDVPAMESVDSLCREPCTHDALCVVVDGVGLCRREVFAAKE